jgi:hypothetical protein
VIFAALLIGTAAILSLGAMVVLARANPHGQLPFWGKAAVNPKLHYALLFAATACGLYGVLRLDDHIGEVAWLIYLVALLAPPTAVTLRHNRTRASRG